MLKFITPVMLSTLVITCFPVFADIDSSGFQISGYAGGTTTTITPGYLQLFNETDVLTPNNRYQNDFSWGFGGAYRIVLPDNRENSNWLHDIALGLDFFYFNSTQTGTTTHNQSTFSYRIPTSSARLMLDSEWTFKPVFTRLYPFVTAGMGSTNNKTSYQDTAITGSERIDANLNSHTKNQFAYTGGAGFKLLLNPKLELSARYLYANLGHAVTGQTANIPLATRLKMPLHTQAWLAGLTYLF